MFLRTIVKQMEKRWEKPQFSNCCNNCFQIHNSSTRLSEKHTTAFLAYGSSETSSIFTPMLSWKTFLTSSELLNKYYRHFWYENHTKPEQWHLIRKSMLQPSYYPTAWKRHHCLQLLLNNTYCRWRSWTFLIFIPTFTSRRAVCVHEYICMLSRRQSIIRNMTHTQLSIPIYPEELILFISLIKQRGWKGQRNVGSIIWSEQWINHYKKQWDY